MTLYDEEDFCLEARRHADEIEGLYDILTAQCKDFIGTLDSLLALEASEPRVVCEANRTRLEVFPFSDLRDTMAEYIAADYDRCWTENALHMNGVITGQEMELAAEMRDER